MAPIRCPVGKITAIDTIYMAYCPGFRRNLWTVTLPAPLRQSFHNRENPWLETVSIAVKPVSLVKNGQCRSLKQRVSHRPV